MHRFTAARAAAALLTMALLACADPPVDEGGSAAEPGPDAFDDRSIETLPDDETYAHHPEHGERVDAVCNKEIENPLTLEWPTLAANADLVATHPPSVRLTNHTDRDQRWRLAARLTEGGEELRVELGDVALRAGESTDVALKLPVGAREHLARSEYSAQLTVIARPHDSRTRGGHLSPPLYLHLEQGDQLRFYDEAGLRLRHRAGDLRDRHVHRMTADRRQDVAGIGRARVEPVEGPAPAATRPQEVIR